VLGGKKMKRKTGISLMLALLMVVSTCTVGTADLNTCGVEPLCECEDFGDTIKEVYNGTHWVEEYTAELEELVYFKITLIYHKTDHPDAVYATDINVTDTLPDCLSYDSAFPEPTTVDGQTIKWDFGDLELYDEDCIVILLNATVEAYTDENGEDNLVEVTATEHCSGYDLCDSDTATVICEEPPCDEGIEVEKKVWVDGEWADSIGDLTLEDVVTFKITVTYHDCDPLETIVCMEVVDYLPCCLDFVGGVSYEGSTFEVPEIEPVVDGKTITWSWDGTNTIQMNDGDVLVITFDTNVTSYCQEQDFNLVEVYAWTCCDEFLGDALVEVDCTSEEPEFDKLVWDPVNEEWNTEGGEGVEGQEMTFMLRFEYYGEEELVDIRFKDVLPCVLEFSGLVEFGPEGITIDVEVSEDLKTVWFNMTDGIVTDGDVVYIIFKALVVDVTGGCGCTQDPVVYNRAWMWAYNDDCPEGELIYCDDDEVSIETRCNDRPYIPSILDDAEGAVEETLTFYVNGSDPDDDKLCYYIDWGDGTDSGWIGPYEHKTEIEVTHEWDEEGDYDVKVKSKDVWGAESDDWSDAVHVHIEGEAEPDLDVKIKKGFGRGVKVTLTNNMETEDIVDIDWDLVVSKRFLGRKLFDDNDTIDLLEAGNSTQIGGLTKMGFGPITVKVSVNATGMDLIEKTAKGFILGKFVLLR
jgi:hypothetical protein